MTNDDLRTALTKLADEWDDRVPLDPEEEVRALLAAHPAPETDESWLRREGQRAERRSANVPDHAKPKWVRLSSGSDGLTDRLSDQEGLARVIYESTAPDMDGLPEWHELDQRDATRSLFLMYAMAVQAFLNGDKR